MLILHGLLGSLDNWHSLSRRFGDHLRVFAIDQRNHGRSPHTDIMSYKAMSGDLVECLDGHNLTVAALLGHSMGGKTAMETALRHPERVRALIVADIAPRQYPPHHDHIFDALSALDIGSYDSRSRVDLDLSRTITSPSTRQFLLKNLRRDDQNVFQWKANVPVLRQNLDELNSEIVSRQPFTGPALFVRALRSDYILQPDMDHIRRLFPAAIFRDLDTGHWVHAEAPDEFFSVVMDFLQESGYLHEPPRA